MAPKHHPSPALRRRSQGAGAVTTILATRSPEKRAALWQEQIVGLDGGPVDPSPPIDQAINAGYPWLEIKCTRCKTPRAVDLAALRHVPTTHLHDLAGRLRRVKCSKAGKRPAAELLQLWQRCPIGDEP
ncbi:hypothetical protein RX327_24305 [Bradyrhizobium sp. BEA-2-5]|uniref:hypothetical protein n=1 Tax=Bradyrhizobium sp. BEA-2-5 TaxID=3080015 RepID=UPI00293F2B4A|nr:hypothetical protein [Bradyrhizobium sp. BEA-2-5]WOH79027.1 hypothetical protein RX327_24305 [Bradyrhizobium sp. BEA-2-5]